MSEERSVPGTGGDAAEIERGATPKVVCNACPVLCQISEGRTGACDRWGNFNGMLTRVDPVVLFTKVANTAGELTGFVESEGWDGNPLPDAPVFLSGVGSGTTYPDYKPAPFIVSSAHEGVDMVTLEARTYGVARHIQQQTGVWTIVNDVAGFIGPEVFTTGAQLERACLEDCFMAKLHGLTMGWMCARPFIWASRLASSTRSRPASSNGHIRHT